MTDAKARRLGRACALACKLAAEVKAIYRLKSDLHDEVQKLAGYDDADAFVDSIMTSYCPKLDIGELFSQLVEKVEGGAK